MEPMAQLKTAAHDPRVICYAAVRLLNGYADHFVKRKDPTSCLQTVCRRRLIRPMARSCFILADYDAVSACHSREVSRARTQRLVREASGGLPPRLGQGLRIKPPAS
jgi:hypothetical protein